MNETLKAIRERRSVRKFKACAIEKEKLEAIVKAGLEAPSGMNRQTQIIVTVSEKSTRDKLAKANANVMGRDADPFYGAPVIMVVLAKKDSPTHVYDGSLTMQNIMLAAHSLGLGSCWIHRAREVFDMPEWKSWLKELGISEEYEGIGNCAIGYVDGAYPSQPPQKDGRDFWVL